ncbi:MAG: anti-sigma factor [Actinomycetota bacterium]|nr:anti-sigma factor [Actinomycetota bacterium]
MTRPDHRDHAEYDGLAVGWALHALEPGEEDAFAAHLAACSRCQLAVADSEATLAEFAHDVPLIDPPPQLLARIREEAGSTAGAPGRRATGSPVTPLPIRARPRLMVRWAAPAMAAAVALIALLGWNVALHNRVTSEHRVAAQRQAVIDQLAHGVIRVTLSDSTSHPVGYVLQQGSQLKVIANGLPVNNRAGSTYVLWAVQGSGEPPRPVGTFDVLRSTLDIRPVKGGPGALEGYSGFSISIEPGRSAPQRPTTVVATGAVRA